MIKRLHWRATSTMEICRSEKKKKFLIHLLSKSLKQREHAVTKIITVGK